MTVPCVFLYRRENKLLLMGTNTPSGSARGGGFKLAVVCDSIVDLIVGVTLL